MEIETPVPTYTMVDFQKTPSKKVGFLSIFITLLIILSLVTLFAFLGGFFLGRMLANEAILEKNNKGIQNSSEQNKDLFTDKENNYTLSISEGWTAKKREGGIPGSTIFRDESSVEIWIGVDQALTLNSVQKAGLKSTNKLNLKLPGEIKNNVEYVFKAGDYFSKITLGASEETPQITFWLKAENSDIYEQEKKILESFKFI